MAGGDQPDLLRGDPAARCLQPRHSAARDFEPGHLAVLDDVHSPRVSRPGEAPGNRVMPGHAAPPLYRCAEDRVPHVRRSIDDRHLGLDPRRVEGFRIDAVEADRPDAAGEFLQVVLVVGEVQNAALNSA